MYLADEVTESEDKRQTRAWALIGAQKNLAAARMMVQAHGFGRRKYQSRKRQNGSYDIMYACICSKTSCPARGKIECIQDGFVVQSSGQCNANLATPMQLNMPTQVRNVIPLTQIMKGALIHEVNMHAGQRGKAHAPTAILDNMKRDTILVRDGGRFPTKDEIRARLQNRRTKLKKQKLGGIERLPGDRAVTVLAMTSWCEARMVKNEADLHGRALDDVVLLSSEIKQGISKKTGQWIGIEFAWSTPGMLYQNLGGCSDNNFHLITLDGGYVQGKEFF